MELLITEDECIRRVKEITDSLTMSDKSKVSMIKYYINLYLNSNGANE